MQKVRNGRTVGDASPESRPSEPPDRALSRHASDKLNFIVFNASPFSELALPAITVISLGMAGAVAPLTTAVLSSVDARHTSSASGLNSALARTGGSLATAMLGTILAATGAPLVRDFHVAALVAAAASFVAGLAAFALIPNLKPKEVA